MLTARWTFLLFVLYAGNANSGTVNYSYSANGNPATITRAGIPITFTTVAGTHHISTASGGGHTWSYTYTGAGNIASITKDGVTSTYTYNANNQLASLTSSGITESYTYSFDGLRATKTSSGVTTVLIYDDAGKLMAEAVGGVTTLEYIYANGKLASEYVPATHKLLSVHDDRLGSPIMVTGSDKTVLWSTAYEPYGTTTNLSNPGGITQNARLPGQYAGSNFDYYRNGQRDYAPGTSYNPLPGYLEADPIGLEGGLNPYRYMEGNPLSGIDPDGLSPLTAEQGRQVAMRATTFAGSPYVSGGISPVTGADCSGSTWMIYRLAGFQYSPIKIPTADFIKTMTSNKPTPGKFFRVSQPQDGDIIFWPKGHMAIYDGNPKMDCDCQSKLGNDDMFSATRPGRGPYGPARADHFRGSEKFEYYRYDTPDN